MKISPELPFSRHILSLPAPTSFPILNNVSVKKDAYLPRFWLYIRLLHGGQNRFHVTVIAVSDPAASREWVRKSTC